MQYADSKFDGQQYVDFKPLLNPKENITCLYADTYSVVNTVLSMCQVAQITSRNTMRYLQFDLYFIYKEIRSQSGPMSPRSNNWEIMEHAQQTESSVRSLYH